jgi:septum formation protein
MAPRRDRLILASASTARAALLRSSGIEFAIEPAAIDESVVKREAARRGDSALQCAAILAAEKALAVSRNNPGALVIGADQILATDDEWFDKPGDMIEAGEQLRRLRGRDHILATAVCVARDRLAIWQAESAPRLAMRVFSDEFLDAYVEAEGEILLGSVGCYRLESRGVQLFDRITGDYFAVLGLPLIELIGFLRQRGVVPA